jgi:hypothetical protein
VQAVAVLEVRSHSEAALEAQADTVQVHLSNFLQHSQSQ